MAVFSELEMDSTMHVCENRVRGLAKYLFNTSQTAEKEAYLQNCSKRNSKGINNAIDEALCRLLNTHSIRKGLIQLADKFPELHIDVDGELFEKDIIVKIAQYSDQMLQIIDNNSDMADRNR